ncbi:glucosaminidase domain-containing protein [Olivibacter sitiensis]|uniref:glucosaminidase domain-containing protein n=1 Tax=Olivibacter sitiensis TaxID=376470 RepID=UPI000417BB09|nr:glucosaminidase domain-containing protein [Olivibacter sitiensis]
MIATQRFLCFILLACFFAACQTKKSSIERPGRKTFGQSAKKPSIKAPEDKPAKVEEIERVKNTQAPSESNASRQQPESGSTPVSPRVIDDAVSKPQYSTSAQQYIERYKSIAVREMNLYGIPASITLAQGLLESGNGNSSLAIQANNHFGIKCTSDWQGPSVLKDDDAVDDCFRSYTTAEESYRDHSQFLLRKRYEPLFELEKNDYMGWAHGLKKAGYATNPKYADLLIGLIERYELNQYDQAESSLEKNRREERVLQDIAEVPPQKEAEEAAAKPPVAMKIHEVRRGDTLYSIGKLYGLTVDDIKTLNDISDEKLSIGQLLLVSK